MKKKFITLHNSADGAEVLLDPHFIEMIRKDELLDRTAVFFLAGENDYIFVSETVPEILALIEATEE